MAGWLHLKVELIKDGVAKYGVKNPLFRPSPIQPKYDDFLIFEGISVDEAGTHADVHIAYRQACLNAIEYLKSSIHRRAGLCDPGPPVQGHIGVVDIPNACATLWLPTDIFEFGGNMMPSPMARPSSRRFGRCAAGPRSVMPTGGLHAGPPPRI